jgi:secreted PhoX family phosphatase
MDEFGEESCSRSDAEHFASIVQRRISRRGFLLGTGAAIGLVSLSGCGLGEMREPGASATTLDFDDVAELFQADHAVAKGYRAERLISWGEPILPGAGAFDPKKISAEQQSLQFGPNNDFLAFMPLPRGSSSSDHGLLWANHEYAIVPMLYPEATHGPRSREHTEAELMGHGGSVVEVRRENGRWSVVPQSAYARRITVETPMTISGPAAGTARMKTGADPTGRLVHGMLNNCAGGVTPWGTVLSCEENTQIYFSGALPKNSRETKIHERFGIKDDGPLPWGKDVARFNRSKEPNEASRFGWVVEIDPYDPNSTPVKRTALGRMKHEGATTTVSNGRVVVYTGDDQPGEYIYKFVSARSFDPSRPGIEQGLLDEGTLFVAVFSEDRVEWKPLVHGVGPLTDENGFSNQADVLIEARHAGDLVGATPMDRPEDIEVNPKSGKVYAMLTGNRQRTPDKVDAANPRAENLHGHIIEMTPPNGADGRPDHTADVFTWDILLLAGLTEPDPTTGVAASGARYGAGTKVSLMNPDNCAFDPKGRLWIGTDRDQKTTKRPDGLYACELEGLGRAVVKVFYVCPAGGELCGPVFTPDGETLFVAIQHPGVDGTNPTKAHWPDFAVGMPARASVVVITREGGGPIGG